MNQSSLLYKSPEELLDQSVRDSPFFRETIATFETDMEEVLKWLDGLNKTLRLYTDDLTKSNEVTTALVGKLGVQNLSSSSLALDGSVVRVFADALQTVYSLKAKLVDDLLENLINPIQQFIREDIREMKDYRRNFDKVSEKYDWAIQKYFSLSKNKEQSALKEDAYVLYETRKAHVKLSLDYTSKIIFFKQNLQHVITDQLLSALFAHTDYYDTSFDVFKGLKPHIENLKNKLEEDRAVQIANRPKIMSMKKTLEEETILKTKPGSNNNESHSSMNRNNTIKEGNLYKRTKTNGMIVPTWSRKYFYIKNQGFTYVVDQKKNGKHILSEAIPINVLLLNFRISNKEDRRFTFEIYSSTKSFVLQAETEEEMNSWIRALQTAKNASAKGERSSSTTNMLADDAESLNTDSLVFDSDEEEEASELLSSRRASITENSISADEGESLKYNDISLERKNNELHNLLKSVPKTDYVFDVFSCAYQKDIGIQGKIYVTQKRICFYSNILTFVTILVIDYQNIINLNRKTTPFFTSIQIETAETSHLFKIFLKDDLKPFNLMRMLWNNANSNQPSSVQELYNTSIGTQEKPPLTTSASVIVGGGSNPKIAEDWEIPSFAKSKSVLPGDSEMFASPEDSTPKGSYELPENITTPVGETPCNCDDHLDKKEHDIVLPIAAKQLYDQLFSENCTIMDKYHKISKNKDVNYGQWNGDDDLKTREVKFIVPVSNPMVRVTETECIENQTILKRNEHFVYVVLLAAQTPNITYGDAFCIQTKICISWVTKSSCRLIISTGVKFFKSPLVKSMIKSAASKGLQDSTTILVNVITEEVEPPIAASPPPATNLDLPVKIESSPTREVKKKQKKSKTISDIEPSSSKKNFLDSKVPKSFLNSIKLKDPIFISITSILTLVIVFSSYWMASTAFGLITRTQSSIKRSETILSERLITKTSLSLNWNDKQSIGPLCVTLWKQGMNNWVKELSEKTNGEAYTKSLSAFLNYHFSVPNGRFEQGVELEKSISHGLSLGDLSNYIYNTTFLLDLSSKQSSPKKAEATYEDHSHLNLYHKLVKTHRRAAESRVKLVKAASVVDDVERKIIWSEYVNWIGDGLKRCATDQENQLNAAEQGGSFKFFVAGTSCSELKELYATLTAEEKIE